MSDRSLNSLSTQFKPLALEWIARCTERGIAVMIVQTSRTQIEHQANLLAGTSGTSLSSHLARSLRWPSTAGPLDPAEADKSDAMDLAPYEVYQIAGPDKLQWDVKNKAWGVIGEEAEKLGLRWGGRWRKPFDPGHAEFVLPWKAQYIAEEQSRPWPTFA